MASAGKTPGQAKPEQAKPEQPKNEALAWRDAVLREALGFLFYCAAIFMVLALLSYHSSDPSFNHASDEGVKNLTGRFGAYLADAMLQLLGLGSLLLPLLLWIVGRRLFRHLAIDFYWDRLLALPVIIWVTSLLCDLLLPMRLSSWFPAGIGGVAGQVGSGAMAQTFGTLGSLLLVVPLGFLALMVLVRFSLVDFFQRLVNRFRKLFDGLVWGFELIAGLVVRLGGLVRPSRRPSPAPSVVQSAASRVSFDDLLTAAEQPSVKPSPAPPQRPPLPLPEIKPEPALTNTSPQRREVDPFHVEEESSFTIPSPQEAIDAEMTPFSLSPEESATAPAAGHRKRRRVMATLSRALQGLQGKRREEKAPPSDRHEPLLGDEPILRREPLLDETEQTVSTQLPHGQEPSLEQDDFWSPVPKKRREPRTTPTKTLPPLMPVQEEPASGATPTEMSADPRILLAEKALSLPAPAVEPPAGSKAAPAEEPVPATKAPPPAEEEEELLTWEEEMGLTPPSPASRLSLTETASSPWDEGESPMEEGGEFPLPTTEPDQTAEEEASAEALTEASDWEMVSSEPMLDPLPEDAEFSSFVVYRDPNLFLRGLELAPLPVKEEQQEPELILESVARPSPSKPPEAKIDSTIPPRANGEGRHEPDLGAELGAAPDSELDSEPEFDSKRELPLEREPFSSLLAEEESPALVQRMEPILTTTASESALWSASRWGKEPVVAGKSPVSDHDLELGSPLTAGEVPQRSGFQRADPILTPTPERVEWSLPHVGPLRAEPILTAVEPEQEDWSASRGEKVDLRAEPILTAVEPELPDWSEPRWEKSITGKSAMGDLAHDPDLAEEEEEEEEPWERSPVRENERLNHRPEPGLTELSESEEPWDMALPETAEPDRAEPDLEEPASAPLPRFSPPPAATAEEEEEEEIPVLPPLDLLGWGRKDPSAADTDRREGMARLLERKLEDFSVKGRITEYYPGPVVTTFELDPAPGLKASKVIGLADDLARSISVPSVRVVSNIPGKSVIGIEVPNLKRQTVFLREILESNTFRDVRSPLAVALGSDITGEPVVADLAKMPHLLVAGTTGSGKSVAVNAMICSILFRARPDEVRFLMVDPKMLELSIYQGIPHLMAPVVTEVGKAAMLLKWAVKEMEDRYRLMSEIGVRNLAGYNARMDALQAEGRQPTRRVAIGFDKETGDLLEKEEPLPLERKPLIVIIIDELADLMIQVGKDVEPAIARLAQMARAAGLHLILATQRPSVDVITGLIKANFPTRLAFQVTTRIDSRTILDTQGAEDLLGMGDGLYQPPGSPRLLRIHAPFVSDEEVHKVVDFLKRTGKPQYNPTVLNFREDGGDDEEGDGGFEDAYDELYDQAVALVTRNRKVSTSMVQRHFKIGYNRAARMVERMEQEGVVSAANSSGKREVLVPDRRDE